MSKRKNIQASNNTAISTKPKKGFWRRLKGFFSSSSKHNQKLEVCENNPLKDISIEELELEVEEVMIDQNVGEPDIEIAFINPETGELEVLNLPKDTFKIRVEENPDSEDETVVILELEPGLEAKTKEEEEEDPYSKITHFPPSCRLH